MMKMKFVEELQQSETKKTVADAIAFAQEIKPRLIESAEKGFTAYRIDLNGRENSHLLVNDLFVQTLQEQLDGCKVKINTENYTHLLFKTEHSKKFLHISWR